MPRLICFLFLLVLIPGCGPSTRDTGKNKDADTPRKAEADK